MEKKTTSGVEDHGDLWNTAASPDELDLDAVETSESPDDLVRRVAATVAKRIEILARPFRTRVTAEMLRKRIG